MRKAAVAKQPGHREEHDIRVDWSAVVADGDQESLDHLISVAAGRTAIASTDLGTAPSDIRK